MAATPTGRGAARMTGAMKIRSVAKTTTAAATAVVVVSRAVLLGPGRIVTGIVAGAGRAGTIVTGTADETTATGCFDSV